MKLLRLLTGFLGSLIIVGCTSTVVAQFVGVGVLASRGMLTHQKLVRFAGVVYGLDPADLQPSDSEGDKLPEELSPEDSLAERVRNTPLIAARQAAISQRTDDIRSSVLRLRISRERQDLARKAFESYLQQLEETNTATALREIQATLESVPPNQAKDIIYHMLSSGQPAPDDDVMSDVVTIIKALPSDKLRRILGEFKSNAERELLHRILVEIGNLDESPQLSGTQS